MFLHEMCTPLDLNDVIVVYITKISMHLECFLIDGLHVGLCVGAEDSRRQPKPPYNVLPPPPNHAVKPPSDFSPEAVYGERASPDLSDRMGYKLDRSSLLNALLTSCTH